jgi:DNA-directed RNA polymerase subunit beta
MDTLDTIVSNPKRKIGLLLADFEQLPVVGNSLIVNQITAERFHMALVKRFEIDATESANQKITSDIPGISEEEKKLLDANGVAKIGSTIRRGEILIGMTEKKVEDNLNQEEKLLKCIFGEPSFIDYNRSTVYPLHDAGMVVGSAYTPNEDGSSARVDVCIMKNLSIGDVLKDAAGNAGVVSSIVAQKVWWMYQDELRRLGIVAHPSSDFAKSVEEKVEGQLWKYSLPLSEEVNYAFVLPKSKGKEKDSDSANKYIKRMHNLYKTRKYLSGLECIGACIAGRLSLERVSGLYDDKVSARDVGRYSTFTLKPILKTQNGIVIGSSVNAGELSALASSPHIAGEMLRIKSDDFTARAAVYERIVKHG